MDPKDITLHATLVRQVLKYVGSLEAVPTEYMGLLRAISDTYRHFDDDRVQLERSLELSSKELGQYISQLKATLDSTTDGILVVDNQGKIVSYNKRFVQMWKIPEDIIASRDDAKAIAFVLDQLIDPDVFTRKVKELYSQPDAVSMDILEFKDGRVFERHSLPQKIGETTVNRVWSFHDVSDDRKAQKLVNEKLTELGRLNQLMTGREIRMTELKAQVKSLEEELAKAHHSP